MKSINYESNSPTTSIDDILHLNDDCLLEVFKCSRLKQNAKCIEYLKKTELVVTTQELGRWFGANENGWGAEYFGEYFVSFSKQTNIQWFSTYNRWDQEKQLKYRRKIIELLYPINKFFFFNFFWRKLRNEKNNHQLFIRQHLWNGW